MYLGIGALVVVLALLAGFAVSALLSPGQWSHTNASNRWWKSRGAIQQQKQYAAVPGDEATAEADDASQNQQPRKKR